MKKTPLQVYKEVKQLTNPEVLAEIMNKIYTAASLDGARVIIKEAPDA